MEEVLVEKREEVVPKIVVELKHMYSKEKSVRGRVLLSEAFRILENYSQIPLGQVDGPIQMGAVHKNEDVPKGKDCFCSQHSNTSKGYPRTRKWLHLVWQQASQGICAISKRGL